MQHLTTHSVCDRHDARVDETCHLTCWSVPLALPWVSASRSSLPWGDISVTVSPAKCHRQTVGILQDLSSK